MIKYPFKYISKGVDHVRYAIQKSKLNDEIGPSVDTNRGPTTTDENGRCMNELQKILDGRYICPHEAAWQILDFHIHYRHPPVWILSIHEENTQ